MNTKFNCPHCRAAIEAESTKAGMAGDCPACGQPIVIPTSQRPPRAIPHNNDDSAWLYQKPTVAARPTPQKPKEAEDYVVDAICATTKGAWKAAKIVAPIAGRVAAKVLGRAVDAAANSSVGKSLSGPPGAPAPKPEKWRYCYYIWRLLGGG